MTNEERKKILEEMRVSIEHLQNSIKILTEDGQYSEENKIQDDKITLEKRVVNYIQNLGVPANIKGYKYIIDAIIMIIETPDCLNKITKVVYPSIAKKYNTTPSRVERAIRHAIETTWARGNIQVLQLIKNFYHSL